MNDTQGIEIVSTSDVDRLTHWHTAGWYMVCDGVEYGAANRVSNTSPEDAQAHVRRWLLMKVTHSCPTRLSWRQRITGRL